MRPRPSLTRHALTGTRNEKIKYGLTSGANPSSLVTGRGKRVAGSRGWETGDQCAEEVEREAEFQESAQLRYLMPGSLR